MGYTEDSHLQCSATSNKPDLFTFPCDLPVNTLHVSAITEYHPCDSDLKTNVTRLPENDLYFLVFHVQLSDC